jgi:phage shock protein PspC (stress-responsive transcriptional regulator)
MKKNITINLCGQLFSIDEDAYEMLSTYEQSLQNYFRSRDGGEEIVEDIEARIAELLYELKEQGSEAVTIENITEIIQRIGKPEEMDGADSLSPDPSPVGEGKHNGNENPAASPLMNGRGTKRLYRDPYDKKLSGVLSGFAAYFGGDPLLWRVGYVAAILFFLVIDNINLLWFWPGRWYYINTDVAALALIIAYIALSILMPVAWSPEDRLRMKGKPINPQNLAEEVSNPQSVQEPTEGLRGCLFMVGSFFRWCVYAFGMFIAAICLVGMVWIAIDSIFHYNLFPGASSDEFVKSAEYTELFSQYNVLIYTFGISFFIFLGTTAYSIIHSLLNEFKQVPAMSYRHRFIILATWIVSLAVSGCSIACFGPKYEEAKKTYYKMKDMFENGSWLNGSDAKYLKAHGWNWEYSFGCNGNLTSQGEYLMDKGDCPNHEEVRYLHSYDSLSRQSLRVERTKTLQPGVYRLTCAARADGTGAFIFAMIDNHQAVFKEIPASGNIGGDIWEEANEFIQRHKDKKIGADSTTYANRLCKLYSVNNNQGYGWNRVIIDSIAITEPATLHYGLAADGKDGDSFTPHTWLGTWLSATDFELTFVKEVEAQTSEEQTSEAEPQELATVQSPRHYTRVVRVRPGDSIGTIAKRNHTSVSEIRRLNRLRNDRLRVGQVLRVK